MELCSYLSTPQGPQGCFYDDWVAKQSSMSRAWLEISAAAESSGRVTERFLNGERKRKTAEQFAEEFDSYVAPTGLRECFAGSQCSFRRVIGGDDWVNMSGTNMKGFEQPTLLRTHNGDSVLDELPIRGVVEFERHFAGARGLV